MTRRAGVREVARWSWAPVVGAVCAAACTYPDFGFVAGSGGGAAGVAGVAGDVGGLGGDAGAVGGTSGTGMGAGGTITGGGTSNEGGTGAVTGGGDGGDGGAAGSGDPCDDDEDAAGAGGVAPYLCSDYQFVPVGCTCHEYEDHAYFFCSQYRTFEMANTYCVNDGMKLVKIDSSQENGFVVTTAAAQQPPIQYYWIGGTSEGTPGSWRWVDGTSYWEGAMTGSPVCNRYTNWRADAPTDPAITEPDQACMYFTDDGWDDETCDVGRMYVCEWY